MQDGDGVTPLSKADQEKYHYKPGEAFGRQGEDWRGSSEGADDTLSTQNTFSFPLYICHVIMMPGFEETQDATFERSSRSM